MSKSSPKQGAVGTGSTLLNLACSDSPLKGFGAGGYYYFVGDSASGKTWLSLSCFAESQLVSEFFEYDLIFDDAENGALMNLEKYFGKAVAEKIQPPEIDKEGQPVFSSTVQDFYRNLRKRFDKKRPFIYVLDSQDALSSEEDLARLRKSLTVAKEDMAGSYKMDKPKAHSEGLRWVIPELSKSGSILIIIGQTRDGQSIYEPRTRSGGRALRFYATLEIWTSVAQKIKKTIREKERTIGAYVKAEIKKNRVTGKIGKDREVLIPIYYSHGIDDVGSCVDYLVGEKHWRPAEGTKGIIVATEFGMKGVREKLIQKIEAADKEQELRLLCGKVWEEIENESRIARKKRYN